MFRRVRPLESTMVHLRFSSAVADGFHGCVPAHWLATKKTFGFIRRYSRLAARGSELGRHLRVLDQAQRQVGVAVRPHLAAGD